MNADVLLVRLQEAKGRTEINALCSDLHDRVQKGDEPVWDAWPAGAERYATWLDRELMSRE